MSRRSQIDGPLAEALARGERLTKAAEIAGCSLATAKRRWQEPEFRQLVIQLQDEARRERQATMRLAWDRGGRLVGQAMLALQDVFQDPNASHLDKTRAARLVLRAYGPREEPPVPRVLSVEEEQLAQGQAAQVLRLLQRFQPNVVALDDRRPTPGYQPPPPPAGPPTMPPWPGPETAAQGGARVGQELAADAPQVAQGPPEPAPVVPELVVAEPVVAGAVVPGPAEDPEEMRARALVWLAQHPHRPPAGPELVQWLEARKVVGLDPTPTDRPRPRRRRRTL